MITEKELLIEINKYEQNLNNYQSCEKLANLYIIYDHLYGKQIKTVDPLPRPEIKVSQNSEADNKVLPTYFYYVQAKKSFQEGNVPKEKVIRTLDALSIEIKDFVKMLYRNTDIPEEREKISKLINDINIGNL